MAKSKNAPGARPGKNKQAERVAALRESQPSPQQQSDEKQEVGRSPVNVQFGPEERRQLIADVVASCEAMGTAVTILSHEHLKDSESFKAADQYLAAEFRKLLPPEQAPSKPPENVRIPEDSEPLPQPTETQPEQNENGGEG